MSLPKTEKLLDAISAAKAMIRAQGKEASVMLLHPFALEPVLQEVGVSPEELEPRAGFDPAPEIAGLRVVRDEAMPVGEFCVFSDEDYLEYERMKLVENES